MWEIGTRAAGRIRRNGRLCAALSLLLYAGLALAEEAPLPAPEQVSRWIQELDHESFAVRKQASRELAHAGAAVLAPLVEALKEGSPERRVRVVELIGQIYSLGEDASFERAELALEEITQQESGSLRAHARKVLQTNLDVRERLAVAAIRKLGGSVIYTSPFKNQDPGDPEAVPNTKIQVISFVVINRDWTGGDEGLRHLRRLPQLTSMYRVKSADITDEAVEALRLDMPNLRVETRGPAYLGIGKSGTNLGNMQGCHIDEVKPGAAAEKAGVRPDDVITHFDNQPVKDFPELISLIGEKVPGDVVPITVLRNGQTVELKAELTVWPKDSK